MAALLSVPLLDLYASLRLTPERQRQQTLDTLVAWLLDETTRRPVLLLCLAALVGSSRTRFCKRFHSSMR